MNLMTLISYKGEMTKNSCSEMNSREQINEVVMRKVLIPSEGGKMSLLCG